MLETFHLVPRATWLATDRTLPYRAPSLATEGFIHCTDGMAALAQTFDRYYADDPRAFVALSLDLEAPMSRGATTILARPFRISTAPSRALRLRRPTASSVRRMVAFSG